MSIEGDVRSLPEKLVKRGMKPSDQEHFKEYIDKDINTALSSILKLTNLKLDKKDTVYNRVHKIAHIFKDYMAGFPNVYVMLDDIEEYILSHFSKPAIKYPEKKEHVADCSDHHGHGYHCNCGATLYNETVNEVRKLNGEGGV